jgi:hypothetical protein
MVSSPRAASSVVRVLQVSKAAHARAGWIKRAVQVISTLTVCVFIATTAHADSHRIAFLGVHLQNDNEGYEPTTDAERNR